MPAPRLASLRTPPVGFAHRGARAHAPENTIEAFQLALRLGATGLESDVWLTQDLQAVLDHDGFAGGRLRRKAIARTPAADLPPHIPRLADLYATCGTAFDLSLDIKDPAAITHVVAVARDAGAEHRLWVCHPDWEVVATWRDLSPALKLVDSTRLSRIKEGPERRVAALREAGIDALNMHHSDWSGGLIALAHRFERYALGWDAQHERILDQLVDSGIDGVFSDHTDRMMASISRFSPT